MLVSARPTRPSGFSIIELMVVMALVGIFIALAAPGLRGFIANQNVKSATFDLTADLLMARSEALKRNGTVVVAKKTGGWTQGWTVTVTSAAPTVSIGDRTALNSTVTIADAPDSITFNANGRVSSPTSQVRVTLSSSLSGSGSARCVELDLSGRARAALGVCS